MAKRLESIKIILNRVRDRYYLESKNATRSSADPEKPKPSKDDMSPAKDSTSSTVEVRKDETIEKSASSVSVESLPKRSVKRGKKVLRKTGDPAVVLSKEVTAKEPTEMMIEKGEGENPANLFSLNISEEIDTFAQIFPPDEVTSKSLEKKTCSRSSSHSSGEVLPKKRKVTADSLLVENVVTVENEETVVSGVAVEGQNTIVQVEDTHQGSLIPSAIIPDEAPEDKTPEEESIIPENNPVTDLPAVDPIDVNKNIEKLPANNTDTSADPGEEDIVNTEPSLQLIHNLPPADSITISDEQPMATVSHVFSNDEFRALKVEVLNLKEELITVKGELVSVKGELVDVKRELNEMKAKVPEASRSEHIIDGAICLFQKLARKGIISPNVAMDPSLWN